MNINNLHARTRLLFLYIVKLSFLCGGIKNKIMKWIPVFCYWLITWMLKYLINAIELIWHLDTKHFSYYGTHFLTIEDIRETEIEISVIKTCDGFNVIERFIYWCVGK